MQIEQIAELIRIDWEGTKSKGVLPGRISSASSTSKIQNSYHHRLATNKGYYITGRLNTLLYRDDCFFDGPDPDMPVRGMRKYLSAASYLFDQRLSFAELLEIGVVDEEEKVQRKQQLHQQNWKKKFNRHEWEMEQQSSGRVVWVRWRIGGVLMLPWRPVVKPWTGRTKYHLDKDGLIYFHQEEWDISVLEAFVCTVFPKIGRLLWK